MHLSDILSLMVENTHTSHRPPSVEDITDMLARHGIAHTRQRSKIAQILFAQPQHLSAEQVLERVNTEGSIVSKATVYNTLGLFARKGLIRELIVDPSKVFYDSSTHVHHHFYRVDSGELQDIEERDFILHHLPDLPEGTELDRVDIIVRLRAKTK